MARPSVECGSLGWLSRQALIATSSRLSLKSPTPSWPHSLAPQAISRHLKQLRACDAPDISKGREARPLRETCSTTEWLAPHAIAQPSPHTLALKQGSLLRPHDLPNLAPPSSPGREQCDAAPWPASSTSSCPSRRSMNTG
eukprot:scaffold248419_cov28-Tisochrysis_lutea.AAC.10